MTPATGFEYEECQSLPNRLHFETTPWNNNNNNISKTPTHIFLSQNKKKVAFRTSSP